MKQRRPFFRMHDYVEFEINPALDGPRYNCNYDSGGSGKWAKGIITDLQLNYIELDAIYPDGEVRTCRFPNYGSSDYDKGQWFWKGYLSHAADASTKPKCECGNGDDSPFHYFFCPMHEYLKKLDRDEEEKRKKNN